MSLAALLDEAAALVRSRSPLRPAVGVVLGSGLGAFADALAERSEIAFREIPHFPASTVAGHGGASIPRASFVSGFPFRLRHPQREREQERRPCRGTVGMAAQGTAAAAGRIVCRGTRSIAAGMAGLPLKHEIIGRPSDNAGNDGYNYDLGKKRAEAVSRYLILQKKVDPMRVTPVSYGESTPVADNSTPQGRAKNRRVEILVYREGVTSEPAVAAAPASQQPTTPQAPSQRQSQQETSSDRLSQR